ncbi:MAG: murein transglycosylase A, partial [Deltaproteobacteria bacterium]|nr:murein transglycosylase A [Deltaproteobacteria bacterium]
MMRALALLIFAACSGEHYPTGEANAQPVPTPKPAAGSAAAPSAGSGSAAPTACPCDDVTDRNDERKDPPHDKLTLTKVAFKDLPAWADDKHAEAVPSFLRSCEKLAVLKDADPVGHDGHGGVAKQWRSACKTAAKLKPGDHAAAKAFFETEFVPWQAAGKAGVDGKMTGYFVQEMRGSRKRAGKYQTVVHARPKDLLMVDLSKHIKDAHGRRIWGRMDDKGELVPFYTRKEIREGALDGKKLELMYVDEPIDLLFAHIEGSAKARMDDGTTVWLDFAGKNGRSYKGVGGIIKEMGGLSAPGSGTMQGIRKWLENNRAKWTEIVDQISSFVFFEEAKQQGAMGSQMVVLTARRSMAIDRAFIAQSTPIWVDTRAPVPNSTAYGPWRQLLIAQDTGGGILGAVRGDIYWG